MIDPANLSDDLVEELAIPSAGGDSLRVLERGLLLERLVTIALRVEEAAEALCGDLAGRLRKVVEVLLPLEPDVAEVFLGTPRAMAWLSRLSRALADPREQTEVLATLLEPAPLLLASASTDESVACDFNLAPGSAIAPFGSGWLLRNRSEASLRLRAEGPGRCATVRHTDGTKVVIFDDRLEQQQVAGAARLEPVRRLTGFATELLEDSDYPELAACRGPGEVRSHLSPDTIERELCAALAVIARVWPAAHRAVERSLRGLLPIAMVVSNWNSASTGQLPYVLQVTVRDGATPILLAESLLHECSHVRLDLAMSLASLLNDSGEKRFFHPWRPDPRPITGVLLGAHAFLAVLELYRRAEIIMPSDPMIGREIETRTREVGTALHLLESAPFTPLGGRLFAAMCRRYSADSTAVSSLQPLSVEPG